MAVEVIMAVVVVDVAVVAVVVVGCFGLGKPNGGKSRIRPNCTVIRARPGNRIGFPGIISHTGECYQRMSPFHLLSHTLFFWSAHRFSTLDTIFVLFSSLLTLLLMRMLCAWHPLIPV